MFLLERGDLPPPIIPPPPFIMDRCIRIGLLILILRVPGGAVPEPNGTGEGVFIIGRLMVMLLLADGTEFMLPRPFLSIPRGFSLRWLLVLRPPVVFVRGINPGRLPRRNSRSRCW